MNIVFIVLTVIVALFVLVFVLGVVKASTVGSDKRRRAMALVFLSQMKEEQRAALKDIYVAYKAQIVERTNEIAEQVSTETLDFLVGFFSYKNRPIEYSSGDAGKFLWLNFQDKLRKLGYAEVVSKIIPGVVMDNYNEVLDKMVANQNRATRKPVVILGEEVDPDNMPILYRKANTNNLELERQLKSIATAWHEGNIRAAMIALESDLEHG